MLIGGNSFMEIFSQTCDSSPNHAAVRPTLRRARGHLCGTCRAEVIDYQLRRVRETAVEQIELDPSTREFDRPKVARPLSVLSPRDRTGFLCPT
jgi:hypothetical protein